MVAQALRLLLAALPLCQSYVHPGLASSAVQQTSVRTPVSVTVPVLSSSSRRRAELVQQRAVRLSTPRMAVSKGELVDAIAERAGVSKKMAAGVLSAALDVIVESVANGDKVSLVGFGTFDSKERAARDGRNPKTGETMRISATTVPSFSFGKGFKDAVKASHSGRQAAKAEKADGGSS